MGGWVGSGDLTEELPPSNAAYVLEADGLFLGGGKGGGGISDGMKKCSRINMGEMEGKNKSIYIYIYIYMHAY